MAKAVFLIAIVLALSTIQSSSIPFTERDLETEDSLKNLFERWVAHHGFSLEGDKAKRFSAFKDNAKYIHEFNKQGNSYHLGLNQFAAMTNEEFQNMYAGGKTDRRRIPRRRNPGGRFMNENIQNEIPYCFDWRKHGAVNPIKNQGSCDCSGAFAATASVESMLFIRNATKKLLSLSEQQLVDCGLFTNGCDGSAAEEAFRDVLIMGGLTTESAYPYSGQQGTCQPYIPVANISGFELVAPDNETALTIAVYNQPVSALIDASCAPFQLYSGGIFNTSCGFNTFLAVTVVGYCHTIGGGNYWIVRNSWGSDWGEGGYIRMKRGFSDPKGLCGIAMNASYPTKMPSPATSSNDGSYAVE